MSLSSPTFEVKLDAHDKRALERWFARGAAPAHVLVMGAGWSMRILESKPERRSRLCRTALAGGPVAAPVECRGAR